MWIETAEEINKLPVGALVSTRERVPHYFRRFGPGKMEWEHVRLHNNEVIPYPQVQGLAPVRGSHVFVRIMQLRQRDGGLLVLSTQGSGGASMQPNPPWVNAILATFGDRMEAVVGPALMPPRLPGRKPAWQEYGCGHYGCVFPTHDKGIVMKVTSDPAEAAFVAAAMRLGDWPDGIVRYHHLFELPERYRGRRTFALWREEATDVGALRTHVYSPGLPWERKSTNIDYDTREEIRFAKRLGVFKDYAAVVRDTWKRATDPMKLASEVAKLENWAWNTVDVDAVDDPGPGGSPTNVVGRWKGAQRAAAALRVCRYVGEMMGSEPGGPYVGEALDFYLDQGLLLADVHRNNVGKVLRPDFSSSQFWAITDPGHMVPLVSEFFTVDVPPLP